MPILMDFKCGFSLTLHYSLNYIHLELSQMLNVRRFIQVVHFFKILFDFLEMMVAINAQDVDFDHFSK